MADGKPVKIDMVGSTKTYETVVQEGDTPRDVLARIVDGDPEHFMLRRDIEPQFPSESDLFRRVNAGDELNGATNAVVGYTR